MNCSRFSSRTVLHILIATILPSLNIPLKTVPWPPLPTILLLLKWSVAFSKSFELNNCMFWTLLSFEDNCLSNNKPPFFLNNFCRSLVSLLFFITLYKTSVTVIRSNNPTLVPRPAWVKKIKMKYQCFFLYIKNEYVKYSLIRNALILLEKLPILPNYVPTLP